MADGIRVLYVDDEPSLLEIAQIFLEQNGEFVVETATSAREALNSQQIPSYDVIISDYQMPDMDGLAFLKVVRERFGDLPFILFTGRGREEIVIEAINNGVDFYIQKGGSPEAQFAELALKIRKAVGRKRTETALYESERRLRQLIQEAPEALAMFDREMRYIVASRRWIADYHLGDREIVGHSHYEIFPEISEYHKVIHRRSLAGEVLSNDDDKFLRQDGSVQWLSWEARPWYETGNTIGGIILFSEDITQRKVAEETVARSKDYLKQIFSSVRAGIVIIDAQSHQVLDINPAGAAMIGLPREQIVGTPCHRHICPAESGRCPITDLHHDVDNTERMLLTGDGKQIPIIKYVTRTILDGRECLLETFIDNRERRLAEDALRASEEKYRLLTETTDDIIYMMDTNGIFTHISPQIVRYGYTQEEVLYHPFTEFIAEEDIPGIVEDFKLALSTRNQTITTLRIRDKAGNFHWMEDNGAPVIDASGSVVAISGILRDVTARKQAEDAQKESEEKFRSIFENSPYPIAINSLPNNKFLEVNKAFLEISGYAPEEILGKDPMEMGFLPLTEALKLISHRLLTGKIENVPLAVTAKGGKRVHVLFSTMPVTINKTPALVTVTAEVTKLKRVEEELVQINEDLNAAYEELTATDEELRQNYDELIKKEEVLHASEEKFRALVELSLDGIIITDFKGTLLFANRAAGLIVDAPEYATLVGTKNVMEFVAPESLASVILDFGKVALGIDAYLVTYKLITATKREVWVECIGKKIPFEGSFAMLVSMRDVTGRKQAEEQVRESEVKFSTVFRSSPVSLTLVSAIDGIFVDVNDAFLMNNGYSRNEVIGRKTESVGLFADTSESERFASTLRAQRTVHGMELKCRVKSGAILTCRFSSGIILMKGKPHILSIVEDITEYKQAEEALRQSEEKFRSIVETSPDMIWETDLQRNFRYMSPTVQTILGYTPEEVVGRSILDLVPEQARADALQELMQMISSEGELSPIEIPARHRNGTDLLLEIHPARLTGTDGTLTGLRGVTIDITERKQSEQALQAIIRGMVGTTGITSLDQIAQTVSSWLGADCVMVGEIQPDNQTVKVLSMQLDGNPVKDFSYTLKGTPCENVAETGFCHYPDDAIHLFPQSKDLVELNIRGYIGTPLKNSEGKVIGILCALFRNRFESSPAVQEIMAIIAVKAGAEIERSQIERALSESEEKFRALVEHSLDGILIVDPEGKILFANHAAGMIIEAENFPALIGVKNVMEFIAPESHADVIRDFSTVATGVDGYIAQYKLNTIYQKERWVESMGKTITFEGTAAILISLRDITERKRDLEALRQANKKLNILSGITRHDIKNQLLALNGFIAILRQKMPDPTYEKYFSRIRNASDRITGMIQFTKEYEQIGVRAPTW